MLEAVVWGLVQGITEFLPVSSSGHLRIIPDLFGLEPPDLSTSAVLHLGTLAAVVAYYRRDVAWILGGLRRDPIARRMAAMVVVATVPAGIVGLLFSSAVERFQESASGVGVALVATGGVLFLTRFVSRGSGTAEDLTTGNAAVIGLFQALALLPGISRAGMVITAGILRGLSPEESGRFGFIIAIPAILGAGLREFINLGSASSLSIELAIGTLMAGVCGYWAIKFLIDRLARRSLVPFAVYCVGTGLLTLIWL
ncbi:MAG: undecaprenyl-diphosphate phosphatase [bacterium]|nr:undecaprenyl-diphosphate phosphatase [bacterium]